MNQAEARTRVAQCWKDVMTWLSAGQSARTGIYAAWRDLTDALPFALPEADIDKLEFARVLSDVSPFDLHRQLEDRDLEVAAFVATILNPEPASMSTLGAFSLAEKVLSRCSSFQELSSLRREWALGVLLKLLGPQRQPGMLNPFCREPATCNGSCQRDPACNE